MCLFECLYESIVDLSFFCKGSIIYLQLTLGSRVNFFFAFENSDGRAQASPYPHHVVLFPPSKCRSFKRDHHKEKKLNGCLTNSGHYSVK